MAKEETSSSSSSISSAGAEGGTRGQRARRALGQALSMAAQRMQQIDREPPTGRLPRGDMASTVGHIKLRPHPATLHIPGASASPLAGRQDPADPEAPRQPAPARPGLLAQYLRLMHIDRPPSKRRRRRDESAVAEEPVPHDGEPLWLDIDAPGEKPSAGLRQRRRRRAAPGGSSPGSPSVRGSAWLALLGRRPAGRSGRSSPATPDIATTPFKHLSEALPWASAHRQLASACATPLAHTRRPSVSSLVGDVSTMPGATTDATPLDTPYMHVRRSSIVRAIDALLLHQRFLVLLSKAMMMYGSPLHHLEDNLARMARLLDLEMTASAIPGLVLLSFDDSATHTSETKLVRCSNGWDMHRLDLTNHLVRRVAHGLVDVQPAVHELEQLMTAKPIYPWFVQVLNWAVISWALCLVCFGGSWRDSAISLALGLVAGLMNLAAGKLPGYTNFFEVSVSILAGILSAALARWGCIGATALSATVVLLPGLVMTTGVIELSSRHMIAGTVRIFYALLLAFIIAYGLLVGVEIYNKIAGNPVLDNALLDLAQCEGLTRWSWFGTFPVAIVSISILVNIHWRHWPSVTCIAGISYGIFWLFKFHLGLDDLAPVVASFALGLVANLWSRITGQTAYMILLPGEMFLVPGSVGVRGFSSLLSNEGGQGAQLALQMVTTCLSIMMGLFASSFLIYPRGKQHSALLTV
ncbi:pheromone-regulated protein prm10 [Coemansia interrupta]|uniref:Pheromone-regulated protein prm10 n=1 Tax=Coemansia interrupta TaxID=1126814 RepID=A0A9W8LKL1_9FUNG|nr:pheromone-regulated protein prm10 [Coemansia interrupta]